MKCQKCGLTIPDDSEFCQYCGTHLEPPVIPDTPSPEVKEKPLFTRAFISYCSSNPAERQFFEGILGSAELKAAYLEECEKNRKQYENGVRISYKQEYSDFMRALHDEYASAPTLSIGRPMPSQKAAPVIETKPLQTPVMATKPQQTPVMATKSQQDKNKQRYCKRCGQPIDSATKKCTGCGKQYSKAKFVPLYAILVVLLLVVGYFGVNYYNGMSAMNNQEFIKARQHFDNLFISEKVFPDEYAYVEAGVLMEEGKLLESLEAFGKVEGVPVPSTITESLQSNIYSAGQKAYRAGDLAEANRNFSAIEDYKRSYDYLILIECSNGVSSRWNYFWLSNMLGFENTDEVILKHEDTALMFLEGRWEDGSRNPYYFEAYQDSYELYCKHNLPNKDATGYFYISNGIYSVGETELSATKILRFSIIDEDTISVYCYKDGSTHKLYRQ